MRTWGEQIDATFCAKDQTPDRLHLETHSSRRSTQRRWR
jgi:hypothetical protein